MLKNLIRHTVKINKWYWGISFLFIGHFLWLALGLLRIQKWEAYSFGIWVKDIISEEKLKQIDLRNSKLFIGLYEKKNNLIKLPKELIKEVSGISLGKDEVILGAKAEEPDTMKYRIRGRISNPFFDKFIIAPLYGKQSVWTYIFPEDARTLLFLNRELLKIFPRDRWKVITPPIIALHFCLLLFCEFLILLGGSILFITLFTSIIAKRFTIFKDESSSYVIANIAFYGTILLGMLIIFLLRGKPLKTIPSVRHSSILMPVYTAYATGNIPKAILLTFLINLFFASFLKITLPSFLFPPLGVLAGLLSALRCGFVFSPTTETAAWTTLIASLVMLIEGQGCVLATFGCLILNRRFFFPKNSRLSAYKSGILESLKIYLCVGGILLISAIYEVLLVILIIPSIYEIA